jgi:hypothetical protein
VKPTDLAVNNKEQKRELLRMLSSFSHYGDYWPRFKERPLPRSLHQAEQRAVAYRNRERRRKERLEAQYKTKVEAIRREIYFGTAAKALAMMDALKKRMS